MNKNLIERFYSSRTAIESEFRSKHPANYLQLVTAVVTAIAGEKYVDEPALDPNRIIEIDHGEYQGTLLYIIGEKGYQPDNYWFVRVNYGSCSGCDTLQGIRGYEDGKPSDKQVAEYMTLALHIVQGIKPVGGEDA